MEKARIQKKGKIVGVAIGIAGWLLLLASPLSNHVKAVIWGIDLCFIAIGLFLHRYVDEDTTYQDIRGLVPVSDQNMPRVVHTIFITGIASVVFSMLLLVTFVDTGLPEFESFLMPILGIGGFLATNLSGYLKKGINVESKE